MKWIFGTCYDIMLMRQICKKIVKTRRLQTSNTVVIVSDQYQNFGVNDTEDILLRQIQHKAIKANEITTFQK